MHSSKSSIKPKLKHNTKNLLAMNFEAIGTHWSIIIDQPLTKEAKANLQQLVINRIGLFDACYSRFRSDSLVTAMSKKKGWYQLPNDAEPLFAFYKQLYKLSKGRVTPLVGQLLSDTGYDASYSFKTSKLSQTPSWEEAIEYKYPVLIVKKPILLDIGAAGKGYLIDIVSELIQELNITKFSINAGGDILNHNASKELTKIGLENPVNLNEIVGIATLTNGSICGSAGNRRSWGKYNHIVDPKTKESPSHLLASWVLADTAMLADGLATALFFTEPQTLNSSFKFEYALIRNDLSLECSSNFPADFFIEMRKVSLV